jgi:hypothetical protein
VPLEGSEEFEDCCAAWTFDSWLASSGENMRDLDRADIGELGAERGDPSFENDGLFLAPDMAFRGSPTGTGRSQVRVFVSEL